MSTKRIFTLAAITLAGLIAATAVGLLLWSRPPGQHRDQTLVIGMPSWPGHGPIYVGDELGYFRDEGINIQVQVIEGFDSLRAALTASPDARSGSVRAARAHSSRTARETQADT